MTSLAAAVLRYKLAEEVAYRNPAMLLSSQHSPEVTAQCVANMKELEAAKKEMYVLAEPQDGETLESLVTELLSYLESKEESDGGSVFSPTYITSCRAMVVHRLGTLLPRMKELAQ